MKNLEAVQKMKERLQLLDETQLEKVTNHYEEILRIATEMFNSNLFVETSTREITDANEMLALLYQENSNRGN